MAENQALTDTIMAIFAIVVILFLLLVHNLWEPKVDYYDYEVRPIVTVEAGA